MSNDDSSASSSSSKSNTHTWLGAHLTNQAQLSATSANVIGSASTLPDNPGLNTPLKLSDFTSSPLPDSLFQLRNPEVLNVRCPCGGNYISSQLLINTTVNAAGFTTNSQTSIHWTHSAKSFGISLGLDGLSLGISSSSEKANFNKSHSFNQQQAAFQNSYLVSKFEITCSGCRSNLNMASQQEVYGCLKAIIEAGKSASLCTNINQPGIQYSQTQSNNAVATQLQHVTSPSQYQYQMSGFNQNQQYQYQQTTPFNPHQQTTQFKPHQNPSNYQQNTHQQSTQFKPHQNPSNYQQPSYNAIYNHNQYTSNSQQNERYYPPQNTTNNPYQNTPHHSSGNTYHQPKVSQHQQTIDNYYHQYHHIQSIAKQYNIDANQLEQETINHGDIDTALAVILSQKEQREEKCGGYNHSYQSAGDGTIFCSKCGDRK